MKAIYLTVLVCLGTPALQAQTSTTPSDALLVLEKEQNTLVVIDPASLKVVGRVPVGSDPHEVAVSDDARTAYVSNYGAFGRGGGGATIAVVDLTTQKALAPIDLGALRAPHGVAFAGGKLYFTAEAAKVVGRYDPSTRKIDWVIGTGQDRTHMVVVSKDLKTVFTSNVSSATVSVIDAHSADWTVTNIPVGRGSEGFDLSPDGKELWVANAQDATVSVVDVASRRVVQTIPSTKSANRLKFTPDGKYVFVSDLSGNELLVLDAVGRKAFKRIALPGNSEGLLMAPDGLHAYTTLNSRDAVAVIDLKTMMVTGEVKTGRGPDGLAWAGRK
jgi:YVTN family beta-propeller protein